MYPRSSEYVKWPRLSQSPELAPGCTPHYLYSRGSWDLPGKGCQSVQGSRAGLYAGAWRMTSIANRAARQQRAQAQVGRPRLRKCFESSSSLADFLAKARA